MRIGIKLKMCQLLGVFNQVTNIVSGSDYPTANLFLPEVWMMKEVLATKCKDENDYIKAMSCKMSTKFHKYWLKLGRVQLIDVNCCCVGPKE